MMECVLVLGRRAKMIYTCKSIAVLVLMLFKYQILKAKSRSSLSLNIVCHLKVSDLRPCWWHCSMDASVCLLVGWVQTDRRTQTGPNREVCKLILHMSV